MKYIIYSIFQKFIQNGSFLFDIVFICTPYFIYLLLSPQAWLFSPIGYIDPNCFTTYFLHYTDVFQGYYKEARLSWIIPGFLSYSILGPLFGHYFLMMVFLIGSSILIYMFSRIFLNRIAGLLIGLFFSCYTFNHGSAGWLYGNVAVTFFFLCALIFAIIGFNNKSNKYLFCSGFFGLGNLFTLNPFCIVGFLFFHLIFFI